MQVLNICILKVLPLEKSEPSLYFVVGSELYKGF